MFFFFMSEPEMKSEQQTVFNEMRSLEMETDTGENPLLTPPATPSTPATPAPNPFATPTAPATGILIEGLNPPPTPSSHVSSNPTTNNHQARRNSAIANHPARHPTYTPRRCLLHLVPRCPVCYWNQNHVGRNQRKTGRHPSNPQPNSRCFRCAAKPTWIITFYRRILCLKKEKINVRRTQHLL